MAQYAIAATRRSDIVSRSLLMRRMGMKEGVAADETALGQLEQQWSQSSKTYQTAFESLSCTYRLVRLGPIHW